MASSVSGTGIEGMQVTSQVIGVQGNEGISAATNNPPAQVQTGETVSAEDVAAGEAYLARRVNEVLKGIFRSPVSAVIDPVRVTFVKDPSGS